MELVNAVSQPSLCPEVAHSCSSEAASRQLATCLPPQLAHVGAPGSPFVNCWSCALRHIDTDCGVAATGWRLLQLSGSTPANPLRLSHLLFARLSAEELMERHPGSAGAPA
ncbi:uncharacterized protein LOC124723156 [Schistocerca piceifrons]|uniref:uncharacterized protein LOC124723156 n=1 Tax=Schistocerca piceifrons TaxID=274613 RepID=UPI001F5EE169|nr:uncharacterized protein LOC124723156 [Schistocerca piceifrons]